MKKIILNKIEKKENSIIFDFNISKELSKYFSGKKFIIEYPESIENVPDAIAAVPFVCNVLPIIWLTDSELFIPEIDKTFFECIPEVKKGYEKMFPETIFKGQIFAGAVVSCETKSAGKKAMFYSGGLDSAQTLISHLDENPVLISIWGSDIKFENTDGWNLVHSAVEETAGQFGLKEIVIHSSFREFDEEGILDKEFHSKLKDGWWHGVKHGLGLLGHVAPYAYLHGLEIMYIAASHCSESGRVRCASNPTIDNCVRFAHCQVVHDGFEYNRQDKVHNVVQFSKENEINIKLHVCWQSQKGNNCCMCEKCYRTITGILAEAADPKEFGFYYIDENIIYMRENLVDYKMITESLSKHWEFMKRTMIANKEQVQKLPYWKNIKWIFKTDFEDLQSLQLPLKTKIKRFLWEIKQKIISWSKK